MSKRKKQKSKRNSEYGSGDMMGDLGDIGFPAMPSENPKGKSKSKSNEIGFNSGMGDFGSMNAGMGGMGGGGMGENLDVGMGDFSGKGGMGDVDPKNDMMAGVGSFGEQDMMGDLSEVGIDVGMQRRHNPRNYGIEKPRFEDTNKLGLIDLFGTQLKKPQQQATSKPHVVSRRGKKYVDDGNGNLISMAQYKKQHARVQTRNERKAGIQNQGTLGVINERITTYRNNRKAKQDAINERERFDNSQPNGMELPRGKFDDDEPVKYVITVEFDDGSSTQVIHESLVDAKNAQASYQSDPNVKRAHLSYR